MSDSKSFAEEILENLRNRMTGRTQEFDSGLSIIDEQQKEGDVFDKLDRRNVITDGAMRKINDELKFEKDIDKLKENIGIIMDCWNRVYYDEFYDYLGEDFTNIRNECTKTIAAATLGSIRSDKKATASRENGKKGGRPPKVTINGAKVDFNATVELMDDEIREDIHADGITDQQEFIDEYCKRHLAKFGEEFQVC